MVSSTQLCRPPSKSSCSARGRGLTRYRDFPLASQPPHEGFRIPAVSRLAAGHPEGLALTQPVFASRSRQAAGTMLWSGPPDDRGRLAPFPLAGRAGGWARRRGQVLPFALPTRRGDGVRSCLLPCPLGEATGSGLAFCLAHSPPTKSVLGSSRSWRSWGRRSWGQVLPFAPLASLGLDYAVSVRRLAPLALRLPSDNPSRSCPCLRLVVILAHDESKSALPQGTFTP